MKNDYLIIEDFFKINKKSIDLTPKDILTAYFENYLYKNLHESKWRAKDTFPTAYESYLFHCIYLDYIYIVEIE